MSADISERMPKRTRLEHAAAHLFWMQGYAATSLADIAQEADVPLGNVYYYFKSKAALADAVASLYVRSSQDAIDAIESDYPKADLTGTTSRARVAAFFTMLEKSHMSRAKAGCPIARSIADFAEPAPDAARMAAQALTILMASLGRDLTRGGHPNGMVAAQTSIAIWQGAIVLAHGAHDPEILMRLCNAQREMLLADMV